MALVIDLAGVKRFHNDKSPQVPTEPVPLAREDQTRFAMSVIEPLYRDEDFVGVSHPTKMS